MASLVEPEIKEAPQEQVMVIWLYFGWMFDFMWYILPDNYEEVNTMCPTLDELGVTVEYHQSGYCTVRGPVNKLRLNIEGARMATHYGIPTGEEFQMGDRITSVWGCVGIGLVTLLLGKNTLLNVDTKRDNLFLKI